MYKAVQMDDGSIHLVHHGIKGQKWGERRFQYEDGSLTPAGKERYYNLAESYKQAKKDYKNAIKESRKEYIKNDRNRNMTPFDRAAARVLQNEIVANKRVKAAMAKGDYIRAKKGEKAESRFYKNQVKKLGARGSLSDLGQGMQSTQFFHALSEKKGRNFAEKNEKKAVKELKTEAIVAGTAALALYGAYIYGLMKK